jgi:hypothetical protein
MYRKPRSFRRTLLQASLAPLGFLLGGAATVYVAAGAPGLSGGTATPQASSPVVEMVHSHDCWSGPAPKDMEGKIPGHVVVTTADGRLRYSSRLVGPALEQIFNGVEHHLTVHAFCR